MTSQRPREPDLPRRRHRCGVAAVGVLGLLAGLLTGCSSGGGVDTAPSASAIRTFLAAHAAALRAHDRSTFLAGLSRAKPSAGLVRTQSAAYDNLVQLPLSSWSYQLGIRTDDTAAEKSATARYGRAAEIRKVTLHYALRGYDLKPTSHDLYWTFIQQDGEVRLAGDSDLADAGGASWKGPWDFGPLVIGRGASTLVIAHASAGDLSTLVAQVDAAVPAVTAVWGAHWPRRVVVLVPASADELSADAGQSSDLTTDVPAATVSDMVDPLTRAAVGLRLLINPPALAKLSAPGRQITLRHEITHIATGAVTSDSSPRWLVEGFADYVGLLHSGQSPTQAAVELTRDVRAGSLPKALPTETTFDEASTSPQAYEEGWLACRLLAHDRGQAGLVRFYRAVGASYDPQHAVQTALKAEYGMTLEQFTAAWRAYLKRELG